MSKTKRSKPTKYLKRPKVGAEKRAVASSLEEGVHVRHKRREKNLPNAWDDKPVAAYKEISKKIK